MLTSASIRLARAASRPAMARAVSSVATAAKQSKSSHTSARKVVGGMALASTLALVTSASHCEGKQQKVPAVGVPGTDNERTFIAIKPDGVQRGLISDIIKRFEAKGYKLVAMKMVHPSKAFAEKHYADLSGRPFFPALVEYFSSGPVVAMVWEGRNVILTGRKLLGATNPNDAANGTIRGDFCLATGRNVCHGSDGPDSAKAEISLWFSQDEVLNYGRALDEWISADN